MFPMNINIKQWGSLQYFTELNDSRLYISLFSLMPIYISAVSFAVCSYSVLEMSNWVYMPT